MHGIPRSFIVKGLVGAVFGLALLVIPGGDARAATVVPLPWSANTEPDLARDRLLYGTAGGACDDTVDVWKATSHAVEVSGKPKISLFLNRAGRSVRC